MAKVYISVIEERSRKLLPVTRTGYGVYWIVFVESVLPQPSFSARKQIKALFQFPRQAPMRPIIAMVKYLSQCVHSSLPAGTATTGSVNGAGPLMVRGRSSSSRNRWSVPHCIDAPASDISIPSNHNVICSLAFATFRPSNIRT
ncbi:hypothetical protein Moror_3618 [Moniliophthora roreri MCA 2997]|uniref:Uncharacterized protein n=2 Tax=Moniliophthora roreri TaxID=221103 RepID=V2WE40_MONRO|nr:hypothetical protein Moror_3618 [Moniliophthora roreri MCA 2997]